VIVLSPHTDDGELGAGGTIARLIEEKAKIEYVCFSAPRPELEKECERALKIFKGISLRQYNYEYREFPTERSKILQKLWELNNEIKPDLVLCPSTFDHHQDHEVVTQEALRIFKHNTVLGYEAPWNQIEFVENCFIEITEKHLQRKTAALAQYFSQHDRHYFNPDYIRSLAYSRGGQIGGGFAEAFQVIRLVFPKKEK
jgi:LmbE family N-acetylglucosaminyl deacetylase